MKSITVEAKYLHMKSTYRQH